MVKLIERAVWVPDRNPGCYLDHGPSGTVLNPLIVHRENDVGWNASQFVQCSKDDDDIHDRETHDK